MAYSVYSFVSQYADTGQIGVYVGTREDNLAEALAITAEQIGDIAAGNLPDARARPGQGEPEGPHPALDGVDVDPDEPARQVAHHRHRAPLARPDRRRDRRGRGRRRSASSRRRCSHPSGSRRRASARTRSGSSRRSSGSRPTSRAQREGPPQRARAGRSARCSRPGSRRRATSLVDELGDAEAMVDFTRPDAVAANIRAAVAAGVPCVVGTTGWDTAEFASARGRRLLRAELRDRRRADDALRRGGRPAPGRAEIIELHHPAKLDAPSGTAKLTAERMGGDVPIHSVRLPGLVAHQEVILGGPGEMLTIRHDATSREAYAPGRAARARAAADAAAGPDRRARRAALGGTGFPGCGAPRPGGRSPRRDRRRYDHRCDKQADLAGPGIGNYSELADRLADRLPLRAHAARDDAGALRGEARDRRAGSARSSTSCQVQVPLIVDRSSGVNDYLDRDGSRTPVTFHIANDHDLHPLDAEVVQAATKWKRLALRQFGCEPGEGILTDMRAVRKDYFLDHDHSAYVDQWDWERAIRREDRTLDYLTDDRARDLAGAESGGDDAPRAAGRRSPSGGRFPTSSPSCTPRTSWRRTPTFRASSGRR